MPRRFGTNHHLDPCDPGYDEIWLGSRIAVQTIAFLLYFHFDWIKFNKYYVEKNYRMLDKHLAKVKWWV